MPFWLSLTNSWPLDAETSPGWKVPTHGAMRVTHSSPAIERHQRAPLAGRDPAHSGRAVGRDPQPVALVVPGDRERMQAASEAPPEAGSVRRQARIVRSRMLDTQMVRPSRGDALDDPMLRDRS